MQNISLARWIRFGIAAITFILWVIWIGNYWILLGFPLLFDAYITKFIPWDFWKKRKDGKKPSAFVEWTDALLFALVAVYLINIFLFQNYKIPTSSLEKSLLVGDHLFVSKVSYGPRMPNTPIAFPLVQNTFPIINTKSYTSWPHWDYKRLAGFGQVKRDDIVVFNFPTGDTVCVKMTNPDFHNIILKDAFDHSGMRRPDPSLNNHASAWHRNQSIQAKGRKLVQDNEAYFGEIIYRPVDRRDNYVKRCVAIPGDVFEIRNNQIFINGEKAENPENLQHNYWIQTDGKDLSDRFFKNLKISKADRHMVRPSLYVLPLTAEQKSKIDTYSFIKGVSIHNEAPDSTGMQVFPYSPDYPWSRDNFGPLMMPKKGETVELNLKNLVLYDRIITAYERNTLEVKGKTIYINGHEATSYTFQMDYYFMLGDNRHKSADSRFWGFVPEDHIVGKPILVWLSLDKDESFLKSIRWNRFFKLVHKD